MSNFYASSSDQIADATGGIMGHFSVMSEIKKLCPQQFAELITEDDFFDLITYHFGPEANRQISQHVRDFVYDNRRKEVDKNIKKIHETFRKAGGCPGNAGRFLTFVVETKSATDMLQQFVKLDSIAYSQ